MNRRGHLELLAGLVNREVEDGTPDAVVVLGPPALLGKDAPGRWKARRPGPQFSTSSSSRICAPCRCSRTPSAHRLAAARQDHGHTVGDFARAISQITGKVAAGVRASATTV
jgi:hypothetical protein